MSLDLLNKLLNRIKRENPSAVDTGGEYEFCPRCDANLTMQKGFSRELPYWVCLGCGEMLFNTELDVDDKDILWRCDQCYDILNIQPGFSDDCGEWTCAKCGYVNKIAASEIYETEAEYLAALRNPYRGVKDEDILKLSVYEHEEHINDNDDVILVRDGETGKRYVKKLLFTYDKTIYEFLRENPIEHMPRIYEMFEGKNSLIIIEEYIEGSTVSALLERDLFSEERAVYVARNVCNILNKLHSLPEPIVHRDVKPSNIIITPGDEVYLLDMNVAKWYKPDKTDDTRYMGTQYYAAPEQVGFGMSSSSARSDIYAVGILMNVMITGKFPKEQKAPGRIWDIIERCISLEAKDRYTASELIEALDAIEKEV